MPHQHATQLRDRAQRLRQMSSALEHTPLLGLDRHAGIDTWRGPRADDCVNQLRSVQARIQRAADDLRRHAWTFERRADELDEVTARRPDAVW